MTGLETGTRSEKSEEVDLTSPNVEVAESSNLEVPKDGSTTLQEGQALQATEVASLDKGSSHESAADPEVLDVNIRTKERDSSPDISTNFSKSEAESEQCADMKSDPPVIAGPVVESLEVRCGNGNIEFL